MTELFTPSAMRFYRVAKTFCDGKMIKPDADTGRFTILNPIEYPLARVLLKDAESIFHGLYYKAGRRDSCLACDNCKDVPTHACFLQRIVKPFGMLCLNYMDKYRLATAPTEKDFLASAVEYVDTLLLFRTAIRMLVSFYFNRLQYIPKDGLREIEQLSTFCVNIEGCLPCKTELEYACLTDSQRYMAEYAYSLCYDDLLSVREGADPFMGKETEKAVRDIFASEQYKDALAAFDLTEDNNINR